MKEITEVHTPTSMKWAYRGDGWEVAKGLLMVAGALGVAVFLNPSLVLGRIPGLRGLDLTKQQSLIRLGAFALAVLGLLAAAAIFYGAY